MESSNKFLFLEILGKIYIKYFLSILVKIIVSLFMFYCNSYFLFNACILIMFYYHEMGRKISLCDKEKARRWKLN